MTGKLNRIRELSRIIDDAEQEIHELLGEIEKPRRRRRTKAELEAERAAKNQETLPGVS